MRPAWLTDESKTRTCIHCRESLSLESFEYLAGGREFRKSNICKDCMESAVKPIERSGSKPLLPVAAYVRVLA